MSATPIAVIGLACRYPGAPDPRSFWENIIARRRSESAVAEPLS